MNSSIFVPLTAVTVSIDSFVAGFSLALNKQKTLTLPFTVAFITYLLCLAAVLTGSFLRQLLEGYQKYIGAAILFGLGACSLLKKDDKRSFGEISLSQCMAIGFGVGLDGAAAALSLALQGIGDKTLLPVLFAATHFVTVYAGQKLATIVKPKKANEFSAAMFFGLGILKLLDL